MPTSRRTSSIFLRSSVSSRPSTTTRPRCQLSIRLMQRSNVDLPLPEGPQITMRSPRITLRSTSRSTWKAPNHLLRPAISIATSFRVVRMSGAIRPGNAFARCSSVAIRLPRLLGVEPPFHEQGIARHARSDTTK